MVDSIKSSIDLDKFEIIKVISGYFPAISISNPGAGNFSQGGGFNSIAHGLGFTPIVMGFVQEVSSGKSYPMTYTKYGASGATGSWKFFNCTVDRTNVYILASIMVCGTSVSIAATDYQIQAYLLKERQAGL